MLLVLAGLAPAAWGVTTVPLTQVLEDARDAGIQVVYSSNLVTDRLQVTTEDVPAVFSVSALRRLLVPFDLALQRAGDYWLVVRSESASAEAVGGRLLLVIRDDQSRPLAADIRIRSPAGWPRPKSLGSGLWQVGPVPAGTVLLEVVVSGYLPLQQTVDVVAGQSAMVAADLQLAPAELAAMEVATSRYLLVENSRFFVDRRFINELPNPGSDPLRAAHRLPGAAAGGWSARTHFRGGEENETAIYLNGQELLDPFHIRDFQGIFSAIDARAVSGVEAWTGGFPVAWGNASSGLLLLETQRPHAGVETEAGLSAYNASLLNSGRNEGSGQEWLVSLRRSTLGLTLDPALGNPDYADAFANWSLDGDNGTRWSLNALYGRDRVRVVTETDPDELEATDSETDNLNLWAIMEWPLSPALTVSTIASWQRLDASRRAESNDLELLFARVDDDRSVESYGLRQDWRWAFSERHTWRWGWAANSQQARYRYRSLARYFGFWALFDSTEDLQRDLAARPSGHSFAAYLSDRIRINDHWSAELGVRWDRHGYSEPVDSAQWNPRGSVLFRPSEQHEWRASWGRFSQPQRIHELQVEDGETRFFNPQRTTQWVLGYRWKNNTGWGVRWEAYRKEYDQLRPRFENLSNPISLIPELAPDRVRLDPTSAVVEGVELGFEAPLSDRLDVWASYVWSRARDEIDGAFQSRSWDQRHAIRAGLFWQKGKWDIGVAAGIHSGWPTTTIQLQPNPDEPDEPLPVFGTRNAAQLNTFATLDFRVNRRFDLRSGELLLFLEITNALDRNNICCIDYDLEESDDGNVFLDATTDGWLPIVPAIGAIWTF